MKTLFIKDLSLFFAERKTILLTFLLPLVLVAVFTLAFSGLRGDRQQAASLDAIRIGVVDDDQTIASQTIAHELGEEAALVVAVADSSAAFAALKKGKVFGVLHIKKGFMLSFAKEENLAWDFNYLAGSEFEVNMFKSFFNPMMESIGRKYRPQKEECALAATLSLPFNALGGGKTEEIQAYNDPWLIQPIIGIAIILLLFNTINIGGHLIDEYNNKTLDRLLLSPAGYFSFVLSKFAVAFLICGVQLSLVLAFASFVLGLQLFNLVVIGILVLACAFTCAAFCLFVASLSKTRNQLNSLSIGGILFLSAIGGSMMPRFIMPGFMQQMSQFSINYWAIESFYSALWRRADFFPTIWGNVVILLLIGGGLLLGSALLFRKRLSLL